MPRTAVIAVVAAACTATFWSAVFAVDPHLDPSLLPQGCPACHAGHGASGSPMLPQSQRDVCLACHGSEARLEENRERGQVTRSARPVSIEIELAQPYGHKIDPEAFVDDPERGVVTCTSCHSPHRSVAPLEARTGRELGKRRSLRNDEAFEYEMCNECHGAAAFDRNPNANRREDIAALTSASAASSHPFVAVASQGVPSTVSEVSGREINCTDCHGNGDPGGAAGPHGSPFVGLLASSYSPAAGQEESELAYELCYSCHQREQVLASPSFPEHERHVVELRASCSTCHNPHGSRDHRALIRFSEDVPPPEVSPSAETGVLHFESTGPGGGACYLSCHGHDHAPATYGTLAGVDAMFGSADPLLGVDRHRLHRARPEPPGRERGRRRDRR